MNDTPQWMSSLFLGAIIAAAGYCAKLLIQWLIFLNGQVRERRAKLVELFSLLRASKVAYLVQCQNRDRLHNSLLSRFEDLKQFPESFDKLFALKYPDFNETEKELHIIIRAITENTLFGINNSLLDWIKSDHYFKGKPWGPSFHRKLSQQIQILETHLLLWIAKFKVWIPGYPEHSLVFLADESKHDVGFPKEIEPIVESLLKKHSWFTFLK